MNFCSRDPEWADVKLAQANYLLSRLAQFKTLVSERYECMPEVIVAGDFNSTPGDKVSSICRILTGRFLRFCFPSAFVMFISCLTLALVLNVRCSVEVIPIAELVLSLINPA